MTPTMPDRDAFRKELETLINRHSLENESGTPDFALAAFLCACLDAWQDGVRLRETFFGRDPAGAIVAVQVATAQQRGIRGVEEVELADELTARVRAWVARAAPRVRHDADYATIKISIMNPQGSDDDVSLFLDARIEEEMTTDQVGGRVPGVRF